MYQQLNHSKWWKVKCFMLDCLDYDGGDLPKETFKKYALIDLEELKKLIDEE